MQDQNYVVDQIRKYGKKQLCSWETMQTVTMLALILFLTVLIIERGGVNVYICIVMTIFIVLALFGLYETIPAFIMYMMPYSSLAFDKEMTHTEKLTACADIGKAHVEGKSGCFKDMTSGEEYALLEGKRNVRVIKWSSITTVTKTEYPFRKKYMGVYFLNFIESSGKKHVLEIHNGKEYNPMKQIDQIYYYIMKNFSKIDIEMTERDKERMENRDKLISEK